MSALPPELIDGLNVRSVRPVHGGDIAQAYRLDTADGPLFCKTHPSPSPDLFARESAGLAELRAHAPALLCVPQVLRESPNGLVLEWIDEGGSARSGSEEAFGAGLAQLHRVTRAQFGGLGGDTAGYLGSVAVDLRPHPDWPEFYLTRRLVPLVDQAVEAGRVDPRARGMLEAIAPRVAQLCGPSEPPALLHGDLWAGNRLVDRSGTNWLIDPACHYGHREYDLAMMALFGGFGPQCWRAYDEAFPLADGWEQRVAWYQLPPLLVHAILFGGSYGDAAIRALRTYR
ncbi:fructosamine kinase family protein [Gephyromycinifex aptenodytis]|uniref:fructosamine kinase family protein n=1 Tax=Gephyromycinifex aptenodytis TaxID=2716227 RepID=UPI0014457A95|nr:fructosamine kinase family protein [Gephyromycinifex aptenodytis]